MSQGRKHEHVEPRDIVGADLPSWMRHDPTHNAIVGVTWVLVAIVAAVAGYALAAGGYALLVGLLTGAGR